MNSMMGIPDAIGDNFWFSSLPNQENVSEKDWKHLLTDLLN